MKVVKVTAEVVFWAMIPSDENEADAWADEMTERIERAVEQFPGVSLGSVTVPELDTEEETGE